MKATAVRTVIDPYEWLPGYGETDVSFRSSGADIVLQVSYDDPGASDGQDTLLRRRDLTFTFARYFVAAPFPGSDPLSPLQMPKIPVGRLVEFEGSTFVERCKEIWREVAHGDPPAFRHFYVQFLGANIFFHVIAKDVRLSEECQVT